MSLVWGREISIARRIEFFSGTKLALFGGAPKERRENEFGRRESRGPRLMQVSLSLFCYPLLRQNLKLCICDECVRVRAMIRWANTHTRDAHTGNFDRQIRHALHTRIRYELHFASAITFARALCNFKGDETHSRESANISLAHALWACPLLRKTRS
jgi:hypothetical protein